MSRSIHGHWYAAGVCFALAATAATTHAGEVEDALARVERAADSDPSLARETREALRDLARALREERAAVPSDVALRAAIEDVLQGMPRDAAPATAPSSASKLRVFGDLRLRHESNVHLDGRAVDRHRQRVRLRVGAEWAVDDEFTVGARVRTGSGADANSPHQTLGDGFHSFELSLDRAYLQWRPKAAPGVDIWGGKFGSPLVTNPVYGELVWDADVQPEGVAIRRVADVGEGAKLGLVAGEYAVIEQGGGDEASAFVGQAWLDSRISDDTNSRVALSWHRFTDLTPDGSTLVLADNQGNAVAPRGTPPALDFVSDFSILDAVASVRTQVLDVPTTFAVQWIRNLEARISEDTGWAAGVAFGRAQEPGDVRIAYQWQVIEQDAVASAFANDDFLLPTNQRGHVVAIRWQATPSIDVQVAAYLSELEKEPAGATDTGTQWRLRVDVNVSF